MNLPNLTGGYKLNRKIPAVSIIIPLYNSEKYIGECLDSILAQTFQDFEVIVVDDCSTDNSRAVVKSYAPKFNSWGVEKLSLLHTKKNSGSGSISRNIGMNFSRGEYIYLMDNDDAITETALEKLYTIAKNFDADVVHSDNVHVIETKIFTEYRNQLSLKLAHNLKNTTKYQILSKNLSERIEQFTSFKIGWESWKHIIRRDLLMKNEIQLHHLNIADDFLLTAMLVCVADNFILIDDDFYIWRKHKNSTGRSSSLSVEKLIQNKVGDFFKEIKFMNEFMDTIEFFAKNPHYKYSFFNFFATQEIKSVIDKYNEIPVWQLDELIQCELKKNQDNTALTAFLFNRMNIFNLKLNQQIAFIKQLEAIIQKQDEVIQRFMEKLKK